MWRLLVILALGLSAAFQTGGSEGSIEAFIDAEMPAVGVPGLAYAVVADGVTSVGARGATKIGSGRKVTSDTAFLTGSISKSFTALAVMQLIEAGAIGLDTEVSHYLERFSDQPVGAITIRQLLSHTSGFSTLQGNTSHTDITGGKNELASRVDQLAQMNPAHKPDQRWEYSNTNYQILGRLIEVVSGQEYQAYIALNILESVGMEHSFVADGEIHESMAAGHTPWFGTTRPLPKKTTDRGTAPQGGIVASATDLASYMQMMMNGRNDVLSAEGKARMMRPASDASPGYGFGWFVDSSNGAVGQRRQRAGIR
ncbi:serine hydrolase domain-containing protein [Arthrobacter sp. E3]|uniref:serine hydrolase n=1 Tax=Arthrobacter sp. E3 TaxID=517402 RepID=UPI001A93C554